MVEWPYKAGAGRCRDRWIPEAYYPASLTKLGSSKFGSGPISKKIEEESNLGKTPRSSWASTHIWPFMYNGHTPTLTSIHSILTTRKGMKIRKLPVGLVWPGTSHWFLDFSTFLDLPSVSKEGLCSVLLNSTDTITWEWNGGSLDRNLKGTFTKDEVAFLVPADPK